MVFAELALLGIVVLVALGVYFVFMGRKGDGCSGDVDYALAVEAYREAKNDLNECKEEIKRVHERQIEKLIATTKVVEGMADDLISQRIIDGCQVSSGDEISRHEMVVGQERREMVEREMER